MNNQPMLFEKIKEKYGTYPKPMMVNLEVAKTMPFKTQTRRLDTKWKVGDVLWVREPAKVDICFTEEFYFRYLSDDDEYKLFTMPIPNRLIKDGFVVDWMVHCNGIPNGCIKEMARTFLRVVDVREEFLQDITEEDAIKEGVSLFSKDLSGSKQMYENYTRGKDKYEFLSNVYDQDRIKRDFVNMHGLGWLRHAVTSFATLWNSTAPKGKKWEDNPKVKVITFEHIKI